MRPATVGLTPRQADCLAAIKEHIARHGRPPTFRDLIPALGVTSPNAVNNFAKKLEAKGFLRPRGHRSYSLIPSDMEAGPEIPRRADLPELTDRQAAILGFMADRQRASWATPTFREIGDHFDIRSPNGVACHLRAIALKGYLAAGPRSLARRRRVVALPAQPTELTR